ncbi:MAG: NUDIX hydrolase [Bacteroidales bacterium]
MIKIYYKKRFISLSFDQKASQIAETQSVNISDISDIKVKINRFITNKEIKHLNIYGTDPKRSLAFVKNAYDLIITGGGVVKSKDGRYLFIYRRKRWDLPKGKSEKNECPETCALREVSEECNIDTDKLKIHDKLGITYHLYKQISRTILKENHWFLMTYFGDKNSLKPQAEEDIEMCRWVNKTDIPDLMKKTYPSIRDIVEKHIMSI